MAVVSIKQLLETGVHFGHATRRWNPKMKPYIYTQRNGIYIIDLQRTAREIEKSYKALFEIAKKGGNVIFVGTKKQATEAVKEEAIRCGQFYVNNSWKGGTLTNFKTIRKSIRRLHTLYKMEKDGTFNSYTKKEVIEFKKEIAKLEKNYGGIKDMRDLPQAIFVVDPRNERNAVLEARKLNIPVFGIVDTNCDPDDVDYIIPANDDAIRAVKLVTSVMANAVIEANGGTVPKYEGNQDIKAVRAERNNNQNRDGKKREFKGSPRRDDNRGFNKSSGPRRNDSKPASKTAAPAPVKEAPKAAPAAEKTPATDISKMTVAQLKDLAKEKGITGISAMKKADLIAALSK